MPLRIAVIASGRGSNLQGILEHEATGRLKVKTGLVLSNNPDAGALEHASTFGVPVWAKDHKEFSSRLAFDEAMLAALKDAKIEAVVLAGYMRLLTAEFLQRFSGPVLNIHPAVLPSFPGVHGGKDAIDYGVRISGCTVHFVEEATDSGPVIIQAVVPVHDDDTEDALMTRIHAMEHRIYPQAIQWLAEGRLATEGRRVRLLPQMSAKTSCYTGIDWMTSPALEDF